MLIYHMIIIITILIALQKIVIDISSSNNINDSDNSSIYGNNNSINYNNNIYIDINNERNNTSE